ncbi:MAG: hypothetical protein QG657_5077, partial [Acidobacteriota bacterium]|nr:hypothetical protein [Acidobacteriota bacterium]
MIEYKLDDLGWNRFEQLCQSLLKAKLGLGIEAWGGPVDLGRDAYYVGKLNYPTHEALEGCFVFQCKFVESANAAGAKPEKSILDAVRKECSKIKVNISPTGKWSIPPTCYALFTNACLTPKTRDKVEQLLMGVLPGSKVCIHDGGDVCQWLRLNPEIAHSFKLGERIGATQKNEIRAKLNLAQSLARQEKQSEGIRELEEALAIAQATNLNEEEVEVLLALGLLSSSRSHRGIGNRGGYLDQVEKKIGEIKDASIRVLYFRTKAAACEDERNRQGAEEALRAALQCCENITDDRDR